MPLDLANPNGIAALYVVGSGIAEDQTFVVCTDGRGYYTEITEANTWVLSQVAPVPLSEVVDWTPWILYTTDGRWFARSSVPDAWEEMGVDMATPPPPCFAPVGTGNRSLGAIKGKYGK